MAGTYHPIAGHGTIRDDNKMKRRIHAAKIRCEPDDDLRDPLITYKEHDKFAGYVGGWSNPSEGLRIFKDIKTLASTLAERTLGQTDFIRIEMKLVKAKMAAVLEQLKKSQDMVAADGRRQQEMRSSGLELLSSTELPKFYVDLFEKDDRRWESVPDEVHSLKNPDPFTDAPVPTENKDPVPIPEQGQKILQVLSSALPSAVAIISGMEPESPAQEAALHKLQELVRTKGPEYEVAIAKLPPSTMGVYMYHQGNGPPSRTTYDPLVDLSEGQLAVVFTELEPAEKVWMGNVSFSLIRVDSISGNEFHGTYFEPSAKEKHYQNEIKWPEPKQWVSRALVPLQIKCKVDGRFRNVDYATDPEMPGLPVDTVQFSFSLTQRRLVPVKYHKSVLEAVERCNAGNMDAPRRCDGIDEQDDAD